MQGAVFLYMWNFLDISKLLHCFWDVLEVKILSVKGMRGY